MGKRKAYELEGELTWLAPQNPSTYNLDYDLGYSWTYPSRLVPGAAPTAAAAPIPIPVGQQKAAPVAPAAVPPPTAAPPPKPAAKRQRRAKDPDAPVPEKRAARFRKTCPLNILTRVDRVMSQRFFMLDRNRNDGELRETFKVLGSTGNVYTVTIDRLPSCDCPDATKGNHCKHLLFIYLKVLQVSQASGVWYQKALLTSELEAIFAQAPASPTAVAHARIRDAYAQATGKAVASSSASSSKKRRMPGPEDDCPICYESMHNVDAKILVFCDECNNALHKECFQQWARSANAKSNLTCVYCRAQWVGEVAAGSAGASGPQRLSEGYLNLGGVAGIDTVRDTSTYYHGPTRGRRYNGYQDYDDYL